MRAKANLLNWFRFLNLRMRPNAQEEIRVYAYAMANVVKALFEKTFSLFEEYDLYGASLSRTELAILRRNMKMGGLEDAGQDLGGTKLKEFLMKMQKGGLEIL